MTVKNCLDLVDALCPSTADEGVKRQLLTEIEGRVRVELLGESPCEGFIDGDTPADTPLRVPAPYDRLYWLYVAAMLHLTAGYTERYEAFAALFNAAYRDFGKWLKRKGE